MVPTQPVEEMIDMLECAVSVWRFQADVYRRVPRTFWSWLSGQDNSELIQILESTSDSVERAIRRYRHEAY